MSASRACLKRSKVRRTGDGDAGGGLDGVGAPAVGVGRQAGVEGRLLHLHVQHGENHVLHQRLLHRRLGDLHDTRQRRETGVRVRGQSSLIQAEERD